MSKEGLLIQLSQKDHRKCIMNSFIMFTMCCKSKGIDIPVDVKNQVWELYFEKSIAERQAWFKSQYITMVYKATYKCLSIPFGPSVKSKIKQIMPLDNWENVLTSDTFEKLRIFFCKQADNNRSKYFNTFLYPEESERHDKVYNWLQTRWDQMSMAVEKIKDKI
jgi:hypothetical protein